MVGAKSWKRKVLARVPVNHTERVGAEAKIKAARLKELARESFRLVL